MNNAGRKTSVAGLRRASVWESGSSTRSAMIVTSAHTNRDGVSSSVAQQPYENSYKLEPDQKVSSRSLQKVLKVTMDEHLTGRDYNSEDAGALARNVSEQVKHRAKNLGLPRYKFVCLVSIGPLEHASVAMTSRCVWNMSVDTYAENVFQNSSVYAVGLLYGIYCE